MFIILLYNFNFNRRIRCRPFRKFTGAWEICIARLKTARGFILATFFSLSPGQADRLAEGLEEVEVGIQICEEIGKLENLSLKEEAVETMEIED